MSNWPTSGVWVAGEGLHQGAGKALRVVGLGGVARLVEKTHHHGGGQLGHGLGGHGHGRGGDVLQAQQHRRNGQAVHEFALVGLLLLLGAMLVLALVQLGRLGGLELKRRVQQRQAVAREQPGVRILILNK